MQLDLSPTAVQIDFSARIPSFLCIEEGAYNPLQKLVSKAGVNTPQKRLHSVWDWNHFLVVVSHSSLFRAEPFINCDRPLRHRRHPRSRR